ncbi:hypothetical protein [Flavobacterium psychrotrophum]|uniref:hypothetical protein n=1 Tax=Flavobacterium psychrotrophum TaxID=2294119 RepID=UPI000E3221EB|nr:hypothetical protein [Flavobacterium psychrotrophum]
MKKVVLSLALVAVLGLSFTSCKKAETEATEGADTTVVVEETTAPVADTVAVDTTAAAADTTAAAPVAPAH